MAVDEDLILDVVRRAASTTVKTTSAIWKLFYADKKAWPEGA